MKSALLTGLGPVRKSAALTRSRSSGAKTMVTSEALGFARRYADAKKKYISQIFFSRSFICLVSLISVFPAAVNWRADVAKAKVLFSIKGPFPFGTVHGNFSGLKANIRFDEKDLAGSAIFASIDAKTVSTGIGLRNSDLRNKEEWLNTDKYPLISFTSKKIEKGTNGFKAVGELTLKGTTRPIEIPFTFTPSGNSGVFKGRFTINREDYKVGKHGGGVGNPITIELEVPVTRF